MIVLQIWFLIVGLCLGSFVNALVWRVFKQTERADKKSSRSKKQSKVQSLFPKKDDKLSIVYGRSMCPSCKHTLAAIDLIPVLSWISLRGRCRYCHKPIPDSPIVEVATAALFILSYAFWPVAFSTSQDVVFGLWLLLLVGFMALTVYDLRWMLLPNRIVYPLTVIAFISAIVSVASSGHWLSALIREVFAVAIGGGIFYLLFQLSKGTWIGGGDVKLGWLLGLAVGTPQKAALLIFTAALLGTAVSLPLLLNKRLKRTSTIPFGPFLIAGAIIAQLFGSSILQWYQTTFIRF